MLNTRLNIRASTLYLNWSKYNFTARIMKLSVAVLLAATVLVHGRPEPPFPSYSTTQQDAFAPPPANTYGAPSDLPTTYRAPSEPASKYGAPSNTYGAPNTISNVYGAPSLDGNSESSFKSSFRKSSLRNSISRIYVPAQTSATFKPSSTYGAPSSEYGVPGLRGYGYYKNQDALLEPAVYQFAYNVVDDYSGNDFGHREGREGDAVWGSYEVLLPDGRKQIVEYEADQTGFRPNIRYEQSGYSASKSSNGPY